MPMKKSSGWLSFNHPPETAEIAVGFVSDRSRCCREMTRMRRLSISGVQTSEDQIAAPWQLT